MAASRKGLEQGVKPALPRLFGVPWERVRNVHVGVHIALSPRGRGLAFC